MDFDYFYDLNNYFKALYYRNQEWFKYRSSLNQEEQRILFYAFLRMDDALREVREVFTKKEKGTAASDAQKE